MTDRRALEQAARWALRDGGDTPPPLADKASATLDDPALVEALAECASIGRLSDADVHRIRAGRRRALASASAAALLVVVGIGAWSSGLLSPAPAQVAHLETRRGQQLAVQLVDGSRLRLNGATSLDVRLEADRRSVTLARGEAWFDVAHDAARPFSVTAGNSSTRVLGTAFDVDMARGEVKLAVYRGKVRFGPSAAGDGGAAVIVPSGWRSHFRGNSAGVPTRFDTSQQDWRDGWLDTDAMRLDDVVETLNRSGGPLVLPPPAKLAGIELAGRFKLDDSQALLEAIGSTYGFDVRREGERLRLVPTPAASQ